MDFNVKWWANSVGMPGVSVFVKDIEVRSLLHFPFADLHSKTSMQFKMVSCVPHSEQLSDHVIKLSNFMYVECAGCEKKTFLLVSLSFTGHSLRDTECLAVLQQISKYIFVCDILTINRCSTPEGHSRHAYTFGPPVAVIFV